MLSEGKVIRLPVKKEFPAFRHGECQIIFSDLSFTSRMVVKVYEGADIKLVWYPELLLLSVYKEFHSFRDENGQVWIGDKDGIYCTAYKDKQALDKYTYYMEYLPLKQIK